MFTQGEIEQVIQHARVAGSKIDFDWFDAAVLSASELGILGHDVEVIPIRDGTEGYVLVLIVNGVRFASKALLFEDHWSEALNEKSLPDQVLHLLATAIKTIKKIETVRDTWYTAKSLAL